MSTHIGASEDRTANGGYIESRITYTVSDNVATITKLEVRKRPNTATGATSGTWSYTVGYNWDDVKKSGSIYKKVSTSWVTLWSGTVKIDIEDPYTVIYGTVVGPSDTLYEGFEARAGKRIDYEEIAKTHYLLVYHYYVDSDETGQIDRETIEVEDGESIRVADLALDLDDYIYLYAENANGKRITNITVTSSQTIYLYYEPANKWFETYHSNTGSTDNQLFNFSEYEVHCWRFKTGSPGILEFSSEGNADTIGWIASKRDLSVNDNGYPTNGSYIVTDDEGGTSNNFKIIYDVEEEDGVTLYLYVSIYKGKAASNVQINVSYERLTCNVQIDYYVLSGTSSNIMFSKFPPNIYHGDILYPADYITPDDLDAGCTFEYAVIRGETIYANDISSYSYEINDDERWNFYYSRLRWTWEGANRTTADAASAEETIQAYEAITGNGMTSAFNHKVWNDLCAVTLEALNSKNYTWDSKYASYANTTMSTSPYTLTALRFNSLRKNIDKLCSTGISEKTKYNGILLDSNKVIGSEFITLTDCLNSA